MLFDGANKIPRFQEVKDLPRTTLNLPLLYSAKQIRLGEES